MTLTDAPDLLDVVGRRPGWFSAAACAGCDPELFYPERGEATTKAKAVCNECPVRQECLEFALSGRELFGIWGGKSERERRRLRAQRKRGAA